MYTRIDFCAWKWKRFLTHTNSINTKSHIVTRKGTKVGSIIHKKAYLCWACVHIIMSFVKTNHSFKCNVMLIYMVASKNNSHKLDLWKFRHGNCISKRHTQLDVNDYVYSTRISELIRSSSKKNFVWIGLIVFQ